MSRGRVKRLAAVLGTTMALGLYGLAVAPGALAATSCTFSGGQITVNQTGAGTITLQIQDAANSPILVNGSTTCGTGAPLLSTTTAISVIGDATGAQEVDLYLSDDSNVLADWGAINFTVNLGSDTSPGDGLWVTNQDASAAGAIDLVAGANGIDLNNDGDLDVTLAGVDLFEFDSSSVGNDSISAAGSTATGAAFASPIQGLDGPGGGLVGIWADGGNNTLTGGASQDEVGNGGGAYDTVAGGLGDDVLNGEAVDYSASASGVTVNLPAGTAVGEGLDTLVNVVDVYGSDQADNVTGNASDNWIWGGPGDDTLTGGDGFDTTSYIGSDGVEVDLEAGTATGDHGSDTLSGFEAAEGGKGADKLKGVTDDYDELYGNGGNDSLNGRGGSDWLEGDNGVDTVSYKWADGVEVFLTDACDVHDGWTDYAGGTDGLDTIENARLSPGDDSFEGSQFQNTVFPMGGQNTLVGDCNATGSGGDTLNYSKGYGGQGVTVNMAGGATAGDSATGFEAAVGSNGPDSITGNEVSNNIQGGKGQDNILGGSGDDNLKGGKGADTIRGGSGDDNLWGNGGKDTGFGGSGDDWGKGLEKTDSIELGPSA